MKDKELKLLENNLMCTDNPTGRRYKFGVSIYIDERTGDNVCYCNERLKFISQTYLEMVLEWARFEDLIELNQCLNKSVF